MMKKFVAFLWLMTQFSIGGATVHEVLVSSNNFSPNALTIEAGDTVRWINTNGNHNVVDRNNSFRCARGCDGDGQGGNGDASDEAWVVEITFRSVGTINYFCEPHDVFGMRGSITVVEPADTSIVQIEALGDNSFVPNDVSVVEGQLLRITNAGGQHNFHTDNDNWICSEVCAGDNVLGTNNPTGFPWDIYIRFDEVGDIPYFCDAHQSSGGIVRVLPDLIFGSGFEAAVSNEPITHEPVLSE